MHDTNAFPVNPPRDARRHPLVWLSVVFFLALLAIYWWSLIANYKAMRDDVRRHADLRAAQSADAMAQQIAMLVQGIDYVLQTLSREYLLHNREGLDRLVLGVVDNYPDKAIVQIAVADASGEIRYSNLGGGNRQAISIADREHFGVHVGATPSRMYIGKPVQGRVSGQWSIQFSRSLWRDGYFAGVIVLSLSPAYLADLLGQLAADPLDTVFLVRDDGSYLGRSNDLDKVLGTALPADRPFLAANAPLRGNYSLSAQVDGVHRFYGWRKLPELGLNLVVGLASMPLMVPIEETIRHSRLRNGVGTGLFLFAGAWIIFLFWRVEGQKQTLRTIFEILPVGVLIADRQGKVGQCNAMAARFLSDDNACSGRLDTGHLVARLIREDGTAQGDEDGLARKAWADHERLSGAVIGLQPTADGGDPRWLSISAAPIEGGRHGGAVVVLTDVTASKCAANALAEQEARLRLVLEAARYGIWEWNIVTGEIRWDERCGEMLGYEPGKFSPKYEAWIARVHEADREKFINRLRRCVRLSEPFDQDFRVSDVDGNWQWLETRGKVVEWEAGRPVRMLGIHTEINRRVAAEQLHRALLDNGAAAILIANAERNIEYANRQITALLGHTADSLIGHSFRAIHLDETHYLEFAGNYERFREENQIEIEYPFRHCDGSTRWCTIHGTRLNPLDDGGEIVWTLFDNTARHYALEALDTAKQRLETIVDRFPAAVLVVDGDGRISHGNRAFADLFGAEFSPGRLIGMRREEEIARLAPQFEDLPPVCTQGEELRMCDGHVLTREEITIAGPDSSAGRLLIYRDITDYKRREQMLEQLATTDTLTELANRRSFVARCEDELQRWQRYGGDTGALVMFDLDHFKRVNDTWGHAFGDQVLMHVAATVRRMLRATDAAGRLGGEEFMLLLPSTSLEGARQLAERLRRNIEAGRIDGPNGVISVTASLGVTAFPNAMKDDLAHAMIRVDKALYAAKLGGRNRVEEAVAELSET